MGPCEGAPRAKYITISLIWHAFVALFVILTWAYTKVNNYYKAGRTTCEESPILSRLDFDMRLIEITMDLCEVDRNIPEVLKHIRGFSVQIN